MILAIKQNVQQHEHQLLQVGVDEAGRGPLVGSVVAAAVILDPNKPIAGLTDSKKISEKKREKLAPIIEQDCLDFAVAEATAKEIDSINILQASLLAMQRAVEALTSPFAEVLVDGNQLPKWSYTARAIIGGDLLEPAISAASILAKVYRDHQMIELDQQYPQYGFKAHKGYPTKAHREALEKYGPIDLHRRSYKTVHALLAEDNV